MLSAKLKKHQGSLTIKADFEIGETDILALFGRSGAGKTSIINMLAGLVVPDRGRIKMDNEWVFNSNLKINRSPQERRFGYVFQEGRLFPHLSVRSNLTYGMKLVPEKHQKFRLNDIVDLLEIGSLLDRRPSRLSGGEKQRVAIGRSLLMSPRLLLMDEPLSSLDEICKREILPFISSIARELAIPILYVSHSMSEINSLTNRVVTLEDGRTRQIDRLGIPTVNRVVRHSQPKPFPRSA